MLNFGTSKPRVKGGRGPSLPGFNGAVKNLSNTSSGSMGMGGWADYLVKF